MQHRLDTGCSLNTDDSLGQCSPGQSGGMLITCSLRAHYGNVAASTGKNWSITLTPNWKMESKLRNSLAPFFWTQCTPRFHTISY